jgi:putative spermidine/putrescine transport system substrate-binding protein
MEGGESMNREKALRGSLSRRNVLRAGGGVVAAAALARPRPARATPHQLVIADGGGALDAAYKAAYFAPWAKDTGIAIVSTPNPLAKLKAMVEQKAVDWDVAQVAAEGAAALAKQGLLEPLDYSIINKQGLLPGVARPYLLMSDVAAYCICWNTKQVQPSGVPADWTAFWQTSGRKGLWKRPFQTLEVALMAAGVPKDKLYPLDVERALASLERIRSSIYWWDTGAQVAEILINGEVPMSAAWNGRVYQPKLDGAPVGYEFNQALFVSDAWVVPKGSPNKKLAMEFIASTLKPERQAMYARHIPYGPVVPSALKLLDAKLLAALPSSEQNFPKGTFLDVDWWAENGEKTVERFDQWLLG